MVKRKLELRHRELDEVVISKYSSKRLKLYVAVVVSAVPGMYIIFYFAGMLSVLPFFVLMPLISFLLLVPTYFWQYKKIGITDKGIWVRRLLFPFVTRYYDFEDFDIAYNVEEITNNKGGRLKAYWLTKDERLVVRIVASLYSNFEDMKRAIRVDNPDMELEFEGAELFTRLLGKRI